MIQCYISYCNGEIWSTKLLGELFFTKQLSMHKTYGQAPLSLIWKDIKFLCFVDTPPFFAHQLETSISTPRWIKSEAHTLLENTKLKITMILFFGSFIYLLQLLPFIHEWSSDLGTL